MKISIKILTSLGHTNCSPVYLIDTCMLLKLFVLTVEYSFIGAPPLHGVSLLSFYFTTQRLVTELKPPATTLQRLDTDQQPKNPGFKASIATLCIAPHPHSAFPKTLNPAQPRYTPQNPPCHHPSASWAKTVGMAPNTTPKRPPPNDRGIPGHSSVHQKQDYLAQTQHEINH